MSICIKIPTDAEPEIVTVDYSAPIDGENSVQKLIGGYVECVHRLEEMPKKILMLVDEEGLIKGLPFNPVASIIAQKPIAGTALLIKTDNVDFVSLELAESGKMFITVMEMYNA